MFGDFFVKTANPKALDDTIQFLGGVVLQDHRGQYIVSDDQYVVRPINGNNGFLKFAITQQGYAVVVADVPEEFWIVNE